jgi:phospho-N-acetylmuramoyl-pentapeptide-transferase
MAVATAVLTGTAVHRMIAAPSGSWVWPLPAALQLIAAGSCVGFLVHNRHPARLFMGNVGSMALGAILATASLQTGTWWLLPIVGSVFVAEVVSDVLQVAYFRLSHGRRLFRMAPLHHHFELGGHHEVQVVRRFWAAGAVAAACGLALIAWLTASPRP